jgi:hypothetical protein
LSKGQDVATVYDFSKIGGVADVVNVDILDQSLLTLVSANVSEDGLSSSADYVLATGDPALPVRIKIRINSNPKANGGFGSRSISIRIQTWETCTVDGVLAYTQPAEAVLALNLPGTGIHSVTETASLLASLYGLTFPSTDGSNNASTASISKLSFGVAAIK